MPELPMHFFTLALNGMPYIRWHYEQFEKLQFPWHWTIVEGVAGMEDDCACLKEIGRGKGPGHIPEQFHHNYLSVDGTTEYLDSLSKLERTNDRVTVIRTKGPWPWGSKRKMANQALPIEPCILCQVDADELRTAEQYESMRRLFLADPSKKTSYETCRFFVGPRLIITSPSPTYGNNAGMDWLRFWRFEPGMVWVSHAPPLLGRPRDEPDKAKLFFTPENRFSNRDTEARGLTFQHFAYATEAAVAFKQDYYGYTNAVLGWRTLQQVKNFPTDLSCYFPWVEKGVMVDECERLGVVPLM